MLKCVYPTEAHKLGIIAATYRAGNASIFGSCPSSCPFLPIINKPEGSTAIDFTYLDAEHKAVPHAGMAWSYTHFQQYHPPDNPTYTTINISTDTPETACIQLLSGCDVVYAAPMEDIQWPRRINNVLFVRCPAELHKHTTCQTCGGGRPLCARKNRGYVIVFVAHGTKKAEIGTKTGGCYAANFPGVIQWRKTRDGCGRNTWNDAQDPNRLVAWAKSLPPKTLLRHRIAGDIGILND